MTMTEDIQARYADKQQQIAQYVALGHKMPVAIVSAEEPTRNLNVPSEWSAGHIDRTMKAHGVEWGDVPSVQNLDSEVLRMISLDPNSFNMDTWHGAVKKDGHKYDYQCGTSHCRAGWAVTLAGELGERLERRVGPEVAGALIYWKSKGYVPSFYLDNVGALADIQVHAALENAPAHDYITSGMRAGVL